MIIPGVKNRIAYRLLACILIFSGLVTLVITAIQLKIEYQRDINAIDEQFLRIEKSFSKQIAEALWFFNEKALKLHLEGISNLKDIEVLELTGEGNVFISIGQPHSRYSLERTLPVVYIGNNTRRDIGNLKVVASLSNVYSRLLNRLIIILISQSIKTFIVAIFIYVLFHFLVIKHLSAIDHYLKRYTTGKRSGYLELDRDPHHSTDELDQIVMSINEASKKLKASYDSLEKKVDERTRDLQHALEQVKTLSGMLPICANCKKIRDDKGYWNQIESYIETYAEVSFSHGICPDCLKQLYGHEQWFDELKDEQEPE